MLGAWCGPHSCEPGPQLAVDLLTMKALSYLMSFLRDFITL